MYIPYKYILTYNENKMKLDLICSSDFEHNLTFDCDLDLGYWDRDFVLITGYLLLDFD